MTKKWVYKPEHPKANERGFVAWEDYANQEPTFEALNAPILMDRFYENTQATDGTDIGSRVKHREYMRRNGLASAGDFSASYYDGVRKAEVGEDRKARRDAVARAAHQVLDRRR